jgi:hypothetical protein
MSTELPRKAGRNGQTHEGWGRKAEEDFYTFFIILFGRTQSGERWTYTKSEQQRVMARHNTPGGVKWGKMRFTIAHAH